MEITLNGIKVQVEDDWTLLDAAKFYGVKIHLFYGKELLEYFGRDDLWNQVLSWLKQWKDVLPEFPEINFDKEPKKSFKEIRNLELRYWRKILENEKLWTEGIIKTIFRKGKTLKLLAEFFESKSNTPYNKLAVSIRNNLKRYF